MATGRVSHLHLVVPIRSKVRLVAPITCPHELSVLFSKPAHRLEMVATIATLAISAGIPNGQIFSSPIIEAAYAYGFTILASVLFGEQAGLSDVKGMPVF